MLEQWAVGSGQWAVISGQWRIVLGKYPITSYTFMIQWQVGSSILRARNFFVTGGIPPFARQTMSGWSGPVNLLTHEVSGQWSRISGQWGWGMGH